MLKKRGNATAGVNKHVSNGEALSSREGGWRDNNAFDGTTNTAPSPCIHNTFGNPMYHCHEQRGMITGWEKDFQTGGCRVSKRKFPITFFNDNR